MGQRVTWSTRPRSEYPWTARTRRVNTSDIPASTDATVTLGPLTLAAVCELIYRVKKIRFEASVGIDDGSTIDTLSADFEAVWAGGDSEANVFAQNAFDAAANPDTYSGPGFGYESMDLMTNGSMLPVGTNVLIAGSELANIEIADTQDGNYYLLGGWGGKIETDTPIFKRVDYGTTDTGGTRADIMAVLNLSSGTFNVPCIITTIYGDIVSPSVTLTATEWWPYATTAGAAAWDPSSGGPLNGGPSA